MKTKTQKWPAIVGAALLAATTADASDLVWIGGPGNWNAAGNWTPAQVPGAADNAFITNNGTYTVTVPAGTTATAGAVSVGGASGTQALAIDRAALTIGGASVINAGGHLDFLVSQSILTGAGNLTVNGTLNWANGTMSGAGTTTIGSGGVLAIGSGGVTLGRTLNDGGSGTWSGGDLTLSANNAFNNLAGGTFDITADGRLSSAATTPINNSGHFRLTAGTTGTFVTGPFTNSGTLQVLASTLNLNLGGTHTGTISNAPGATLNFGAGTHLLATGSTVTGAGVVSVSGGATVLTASDTFDVAGTTLSLTAGTATLTAGCNVAGTTLNVGGGVLVFNSSGAVGAVNLTAGTLGGTSPVTVTGPLTLGGGTVTNALVTANGGLTINGNVTLNSTKLVNPGAAVWSAGNFNASNGAVISNLFGATFTNTFDGNMNVSGAMPLFVNAGAFRKTGATAAAGTTSIDAHFINTGTVEVQTNTLRYAINEQTAGLTLLDGGNLAAQAQPLQLLGGRLIGTGSITLAHNQNFINSASLSPGLSPGELDISGNYQQTSSGALNIELGGYVAGTEFDLITVTAGGAGGVATLGGTLNVTLINGFSPTNGATFTFLTAVGRFGTFATFNYPSNDIGMQLNIGPTSASIKVTNLKPVVANPIVDPAAIIYGGAFNFQFPANTFSDPDNNTLTYTVSGMPAGVTFTDATRTFSGTPTQAGVFIVAVAATNNGSPSLSVTNTFTLTVTPANVTGNFTASDKTYDGTNSATVLTRTLNGVLAADTANVSLAGGTASFATAIVGPGKTVTLTGATLTGSAAGNYSLTSVGTTTAAITAPPPLLLPLTFMDKTNVVIAWSAVTNGLYRVQYKSDLNTTNWNDLSGDVTASSSTASKTDLLTATNRFYRVQVLP